MCCPSSTGGSPRLREEGERSDLERHWGRIEAVARLFLQDEESHCREREPAFFELAFGIPGEGMEETVEISLEGGVTFRLRGRIDRVDRVGEGAYEIWDYKTGSAGAFQEPKAYERGRVLQHALYALAGERVLKRILGADVRVVKSGYFFASPKGDGERISRTPGEWGSLGVVLRLLFEMLKGGVFPAGCEKKLCGFCDYRAVCGGEEAASRTLDLGLDPFALRGAYEAVALFPEVEEPDLSGVREELKGYLDLVRRHLPEDPPPRGWCPLQRVLRSALARARYLDLEHNPSLVQVLKGLESNAHVTLNRWPDADMAHGQQTAFEGFREGVVKPALCQWSRYCHAPVMDLVVPAVEQYRLRREKESTLNYGDLLLRATALVRENPEVRGTFQKRFTHLLVDEFQDTDPIQAEMPVLLAGKGVKETSWRRVKVRPGALFVVGDPKQSIYRFRRADIDTYNEVKRIIRASGGLVLALTSNFRSLPPVCAWANGVFRDQLPQESTPEQAAFERLDPYQEAREGDVRKITLSRVPHHRENKIVQEDAERIAAFIARAIEEGHPVHRSASEVRAGLGPLAAPGDFLILLRYRAHLAAYGRALEARGIPFQVTGAGGFGGSEEVGHLVSLLKAVAEPEDRISLVAALRGPFFGISDDLLYRYRRGGGRFSIYAQPDGRADAEAAHAVCGASRACGGIAPGRRTCPRRRRSAVSWTTWASCPWPSPGRPGRPARGTCSRSWRSGSGTRGRSPTPFPSWWTGWPVSGKGRRRCSRRRPSPSPGRGKACRGPRPARWTWPSGRRTGGCWRTTRPMRWTGTWRRW